jgi:CRP-like cAMP-binding protein
MSETISRSIEAMSRLPLFASLTPRELSVLSKHLTIRKLPPFAPLFEEGDPGQSCFVVLRGQVEVIKVLTNGNEERLAMLDPGALLGHMALIDNQPRSASCRANITGARLLSLGRSDFELLLNARSTFAYKILDQVALDLSARLRGATERLADARHVNSPEGRKAAAKAAAKVLMGFEVPDSIHGIDLDAIEIEAVSQDRRVKRR